MATTQERLDSYYVAEAEILSAQETAGGDRKVRMAELKDIQKQIAILEARLTREQNALNGTQAFAVANLNWRSRS